MSHKIIEIEGAVGKTVQRITVTNEFDFRDITVRFSDQTAIHFTLRLRIEIEPEILDWKTGDGETVREFPIEKPTGEVFELVDEITAFAAAVRDGAPLPASGEDGRWSVTLCLRAQESVDSGKPVSF